MEKLLRLVLSFNELTVQNMECNVMLVIAMRVYWISAPVGRFLAIFNLLVIYTWLYFTCADSASRRTPYKSVRQTCLAHLLTSHSRNDTHFPY